jgi:hypothetical protein
LKAELDGLLKAQKDREQAQTGQKVEESYTLYQTLFAYKSADEGDLNFEAGEILRLVGCLAWDTS